MAPSCGGQLLQNRDYTHDRIVSKIAFPKAGRSQVGSFVHSLDKSFFCRVTTVATLPSALSVSVSRSVQEALHFPSAPIHFAASFISGKSSSQYSLGRRPSLGCNSMPRNCTRRIFPEMVLGSSENSIRRIRL